MSPDAPPCARGLTCSRDRIGCTSERPEAERTSEAGERGVQITLVTIAKNQITSLECGSIGYCSSERRQDADGICAMSSAINVSSKQQNRRNSETFTVQSTALLVSPHGSYCVLRNSLNEPAPHLDLARSRTPSPPRRAGQRELSTPLM